MEEYYLFTFDSTHYAIHAQKLLKDLEPVIMPTLREISASCGISLKVQPNRIREACERMTEGVQGWHLYRILKDGKKITCTICKRSDTLTC